MHSRKLGAPTGRIMNSWMSTLLSAWAPPLRMFIIGHGQHAGGGAAQVPVERLAAGLGGGVGDGHGGAEHGVGAEPALVLRAVQVEEEVVELGLLERVHALEGILDLGVEGLHRAQHPFALVALLVPVAQLEGFAAAGGCPGRNHRLTDGSVIQRDPGQDRGIAAAVQDFKAGDSAQSTSWLDPYTLGGS